jgi:Phage Mu protein F like protein
MNARQRSEYWVKVERLRRQLDQKYSSLFSAAISKDVNKVASDIRKYGTDAARTLMGAYAWNDEMMTIMMQLYKEAAILFGNASFRAVRNAGQKAADPYGINNDFITSILQFLAQYGFMLVADMTQTTKKQLLNIISQGVADGLGIDEIARQLTQSDELGYAMMRARRIARTEVMRASNYAAMEGAKLHNFEVDKIWIASRDLRTRRIPRDSYDHFHMDGATVPYNEPFTSTGKKGDTVLASQPGDPNAPAGFTINCRCTVGFVPKRDENGRLIMKR